MTELACREEVVRIAKKLYERQMVNTNEGNVSIREGDYVYITPSQVCKELLTPEMIVVIDMDGNQISKGLKASSEYKLHTHIYRLRDDVHSVVHNHSPFATAFAIANKPIASKGYVETIYFYDYIPVVKYGLPGTDKIVEGIKDYIYQTDVMLLANHGLVSVGATAMDAYLLAESVESVAKTLTINSILGGEKAFNHAELEDIYQMRKNNLGKDKIKES